MKDTSHFVHKPDLTNTYHVYETEVPFSLAFRLNFYPGLIELNGLVGVTKNWAWIIRILILILRSGCFKAKVGSESKVGDVFVKMVRMGNDKTVWGLSEIF